MKKTVKLIKFLWHLWIWIIGKGEYVVYFRSHPNVGDLMNADVFGHFNTKSMVDLKFPNIFQHTLMIGSVAQNMNRRSIVRGAGFISENSIQNVTSLGTIKALRGELSKELIKNKFDIELSVPLGDPALLTPRLFNFELPITQAKYEFGFAAHYADHSIDQKRIVENMGGLYISVEQNLSDFVSQLLACKIIMSSSLHGLILSDSFGLPNTWIQLGDRLTGGDFKFKDYYSTMYPEKVTPLISNDYNNFEGLISDAISAAQKHEYKYDLDELQAAIVSNVKVKVNVTKH